MKRSHSVIIIDDEAIIRDGLCDMVDWQHLGYEVVACFSDGRDAIAYLEDHQVDVVLTDIMMDDVGGIEVAKYAYEKKPDTRVVIVSGYRDFGFARDAIRFHAASYLLKPIDFDELNAVFSDLKREIIGSHRRRDGFSLRHLLSDIVAGRVVTRRDLVDQIEALGLDFDVDATPAALVLIDSGTEKDRGQLPTIRDGIVSALRKHARVSLYEPALTLNNRIVALAVDAESPDAETLKEKLQERATSAIDSLRAAFHIAVTATVVACERGLAALVESGPASIVERALESHRPPRRPDRVSGSDSAIRRVVAYLNDNYASDVSLSEASALVYLSPGYFSRYFHEQIGETFTEYLASIRVKKAIELLRTGELKVYEVGKRVGYRNPRYFARVFKKETGYSPRAYCTEVLAREGMQ